LKLQSNIFDWLIIFSTSFGHSLSHQIPLFCGQFQKVAHSDTENLHTSFCRFAKPAFQITTLHSAVAYIQKAAEDRNLGSRKNQDRYYSADGAQRKHKAQYSTKLIAPHVRGRGVFNMYICKKSAS
jgi:hypothetical protein